MKRMKGLDWIRVNRKVSSWESWHWLLGASHRDMRMIPPQEQRGPLTNEQSLL